ncbi:hypothetical protein BH18CHL2_BH18CHL2_05720 [soil metagenome]
MLKSAGALVTGAASELLPATDEGSVVAAAMRSLRDRYNESTRALILRKGERLRIAAAEGPFAAELAARGPDEIAASLVGACIVGQRLLNVRDARRDPRFVRAALAIRSQICVPLVAGDQVLGALSLESPYAGAFAETDEGELAAVAQLVALAISHTRLHAKRSRDLAELHAIT